MINFFKRHYILFLILTLGFILRLWGINYDLPLSSAVPDEANLLTGALKMLGEGSPILHFGGEQTVYFPLMYYVYAVAVGFYSLFFLAFSEISSIVGLKALAIVSLGDWIIVGRIISVLMGTASIYLLYIISGRLFKQKSVAYLAALFMAISPINVALSHFGKVWTPQVFFILLSFYFCLRIWKNSNIQPTISKVFWTAVVVLTSFATNLIGILSYPLMLLIILSYYCQFNFKKFFKFLISRWSALLHLFLILGTGLIIFLGQESFRSYMASWTVANSNDGLITGEAVFWNLSLLKKVGLSLDMLLQFETIAFILLVPAFWFLYKKSKHFFWFLFLGFLGFFLALGPPILDASRPRFLSLLVPFMFLPVAYFLAQWINKKNIIIIILIILIVSAPALFIDARYSYLLSQNSTKFVLYDWIETNLQPGEKILMYGGYLSQDIVPDKELVNLIKEYSPSYYSTRLKYLENNLPQELESGYGIYSVAFVCQWPKEVIESLEFDYIATIRINEGQAWVGSNLSICDNIPTYHLNNDQIILDINTAPYYNYTVESSVAIESYRPLWQINQLGAGLKIYKVNK